MLTISQAQMAALAASLKRAAADRLFRQISAAHPVRFEMLSEAEGRAVIARGIEMGSRYGIETETDLGVFLDLMVRLEASFQARLEQGWLSEAMRSTELSSEAKVQLLRAEMQSEPKGR